MIRILVVCRANICRSPFAQMLLENALTSWAVPPQLIVSSAGTGAHPGASICPLVAGSVGPGATARTGVHEHRSRALDAGLINAADLILSAEAGQRGLASAAAPRSQSRIFTLAEAAALTELVGTLGAGRHASPEVRFAAWVRSLDDARGMRAVHQGSVRRFGGARRPEPPWDIPDGHSHSPRQHRRALARVERAVATIALSIGSLV